LLWMNMTSGRGNVSLRRWRADSQYSLHSKTTLFHNSLMKGMVC